MENNKKGRMSEDIAFLDALLEDLQNSSRGNVKKTTPSKEFPPPPTFDKKGMVITSPNISADPYNPLKQKPPHPESKGFRTVDSCMDNHVNEEQTSFNLSELEGLLQDLDKASDLHRKSQIQQQTSQACTTSVRNEGLSNGTSNGTDKPAPVSVGAVEALLDELDTQVSHSKNVNQRPQPGRIGILNQTGPPRTASSATKELDDLMNSLSGFKVISAEPRNEGRNFDCILPMPSNPVAPVEPDYAKVEKHPPPTSQKPKSASATSPIPQQPVNNLNQMLEGLSSNLTKQGVTTVTKGTCAGCNKPIIGQVCTALGKTWHPEHFACCICEMELGTKTFFERDGKPYCEGDYHDIFAPKCFACNGPILDSCVTSMDRTWHPEHFVCNKCGRPFGESGFHEKDGKAYCREDYFKLFAPKCSGCNEAIIENYISALNGHWHPQCFACMECHQPFQNGSFFEHEGMPYCEMHYHAKRGSLCYSCQKPITGRCITAMHRKFHPEHFICAFCLKQLNKGTFKEQNDKPYCHACFVKLFG